MPQEYEALAAANDGEIQYFIQDAAPYYAVDTEGGTMRAGIVTSEVVPKLVECGAHFAFDARILGAGAVALSATLELYVTGLSFAAPGMCRTSTFRLYVGKVADPETMDRYPSDTLTWADWTLDRYTLIDGLAADDLDIVPGWNSIALNAVGCAALSGTNLTKFTLRHGGDEARHGYITIATAESANGPSLNIEYTHRGITRRAFVRPNACLAGDLFYHDGAKVVRLPAGGEGTTLKIGENGLPYWG